MKKKPFVEVSEYTREMARRSPEAILAKLRKELDEAKCEKKQVERDLAEIEALRKQELAYALSSRIPKHESVQQTIRIQNNINQKKKPVLERMYACEERIHSIKTRIANAAPTKSADATVKTMELNCLERIELLLKRIVKEMEKHNA